MSVVHRTAPSKPAKPSADFPLFPHATKRWAKKIKGKTRYFGTWDDPQAALRAYHEFIGGKLKAKRPAAPSAATGKPIKPSPDFPLFPHATGRWAKKIRGLLHYFGKWDDPDGALAKYLAEKDDLHAGRTPREAPEALTTFALCGKFLTTKKRLLDVGELSPRTFAEYTQTCRRLIRAFGKGRLIADLRPDDFERLRAAIARKWGPVRLGNEVIRVRSVFNYGFKSGLLERPMVYGEGFHLPSKRTLRQHRHAQGPRMFEAQEIHEMLAAAGPALRAMILLGVNCGFGNSDVASLPLAALELAGGWVNYPRPKTGINRRCPLWAETVTALEAWLAKRPKPHSETDAGLVFITKYGHGWQPPGKPMNSPVSQETRKLMRKLGINGHRNFYALRHTFQTIGDECGDPVAVRAIMGHADNDISAHYRERISDERLKRVVESIRVWLFPATRHHPSGRA
jgi:integrase